MSTGLTARRSTRMVAHRRRQAGSQGGVALILVLGAIVLTSAVLLALFGLAVTSARVTTAQRDQARERRAASAAIDSAIGQIARTDATDVCESLSPTADAQIQIRENPARPGIVVDVGCSEMPWLAPGAPPIVVEQPQLDPSTPGAQSFSIAPVADCAFNPSSCMPRTITTKWTAGGTQPMSSLYLLIASHEGQNVHQLNRNLRINVAVPGHGSCLVQVPGGRNNEWTGAYTSVDLISNGCQTLLGGQPQSLLNGATITVTHRYVVAEGCIWIPWALDTCKARLHVSDLRLVSNLEVMDATALISAGGWESAASAVVVDDQAASIPLSNCMPFTADPRCRRVDPGTAHSIAVGGFSIDSTTFDSDDAVDRLGVVLDSRRRPSAPDNPPRSWISDVIDETYFKVGLDTGDGSCEVQFGGFARSNQQVFVDMFTSPQCRELVQTVGDLTGATVTYSIGLDCMYDWNGVQVPILPDGDCWSVTPPELDRIALAVSTLPEPPSSLVTLTAAVDGRIITEADLYLDGSPDLPRATPVIAWRYGTRAIGPAPPTGP